MISIWINKEGFEITIKSRKWRIWSLLNLVMELMEVQSKLSLTELFKGNDGLTLSLGDTSLREITNGIAWRLSLVERGVYIN